jgi:hypothetical protein
LNFLSGVLVYTFHLVYDIFLKQKLSCNGVTPQSSVW